MREQIFEIIARILEMDIKAVNEKLSIESTEKWDSLAHLMIIGEIEEKLKVNIPLETVLELSTVQDLLDAIQK
ncbi:acyl carrier protein [Mobilisporobacter senegalensis]|uniref:Acyl carrier protein n=1 Tax=Mobilisporobacter senegalensis TaxID=1329262 RepID=A0A3N1XZ79_9FIRM|nr:acyl carrier protein [Mobilisporobacter senegalensis]ROR31541.1 acyl carrier protein [Mobilisporobacter senegalensis]